MRARISSGLALFLALALAACGPGGRGGGDDDDDGPGGGPDSGVTGTDSDGDGYNSADDCDDSNPAVNPGATDICNNLDDNCNNRIDEPCTDDDGDGFSENDGDCNDAEKLINPNSVEVPTKMDGTPEGVDNDCNGLVDEAPQACDQGLSPQNPMHLARAIDLCKNLTTSSMNADADAMGHTIVGTFGTYVPKLGTNMASLASGMATAPVSGQYSFPGQLLGHPHPAPMGNPNDGCGMADEATVYDYTEWVLEIDVPQNAKSFSFDFNFMSAEYPEWVCQRYDDTFLAVLTSQMFNGNISFDAKGKPVTVNIGFFDVCAPGSEPPGKMPGSCTGAGPLTGTGYEPGGIAEGGGTGWLTTTAPVTPGEHITLKFYIFDEGDHAYDSSVLIDNFRWLGEPVDGPITIPRVDDGTQAVPVNVTR
jgi:hypothetical protein